MARPKPDILQFAYNKETMVYTEILKNEGYFAILYKGKSFNLRQYTEFQDSFKYKKICFPSYVAAKNNCEKLNIQFKCEDFTVKRLK